MTRCLKCAGYRPSAEEVVREAASAVRRLDGKAEACSEDSDARNAFRVGWLTSAAAPLLAHVDGLCVPCFMGREVAACTYEDREGRCDANDGEPCAKCAARDESEAAYWKVESCTVTLAEGDPEAYRRNLADAGRGGSR
jgi:hypothetical protein